MNTKPVDDNDFLDPDCPAALSGKVVAASAPTCPSIISSQLLGGKHCTTIDHEGVRYILRATRGSKLILTK